MFRSSIALALLALLPSAALGAQTKSTPAQLHVSRALELVAEQPSRAAGYDELAMGLSRRARETADPAYYERAMGALKVSRSLEPDGYRSKKVRAWVLLGQHRFEEARTVATALVKEAPDDLQLYGILVDAHVELGDYAAAEAACQWLLDMRPGNIPGLTRAAHLRELFGDIPGARDMMQQAYHSTSPREKEDRAWMLTQLAELDLKSGWPQRALVLADEALALFPDYHYALAAKAKSHAQMGEHAASLKAWKLRYELAPHPENLFDLALEQKAAGKLEEAQDNFAQFETAALGESGGMDNANRSLIRYYIEVAERPQDALRLAKAERSRRADVQTRMHLAWAAFHGGDIETAYSEAQEALQVGFSDPELRLWAARIALAKGDADAARDHVQVLLSTAPMGADAEEARGLLSELASGH